MEKWSKDMKQGEKTMFTGVALIVATLSGAIMGVNIAYTPLIILAGCAWVIMGALLTVKEEN